MTEGKAEDIQFEGEKGGQRYQYKTLLQISQFEKKSIRNKMSEMNNKERRPNRVDVG
jgi:hypothetical protein